MAANQISREYLSVERPYHAAAEEVQGLPLDGEPLERENIRDKIHAIVCGVLGSSITADQPLMEVHLMSHLFSAQFC